MGVIRHFMALVTEAQKGPADILKTHCLLHLITCTPVAQPSCWRLTGPFILLGLRNDPQCCVHVHVVQHLMSEVFLPDCSLKQGLSLNLELSLSMTGLGWPASEFRDSLVSTNPLPSTSIIDRYYYAQLFYGC